MVDIIINQLSQEFKNPQKNNAGRKGKIFRAA